MSCHIVFCSLGSVVTGFQLLNCVQFELHNKFCPFSLTSEKKYMSRVQTTFDLVFLCCTLQKYRLAKYIPDSLSDGTTSFLLSEWFLFGLAVF